MIKKETIKRHLISAGVTFVATFAVIFSAGIMDINFIFDKVSITALLGGALMAAVRAVAKIIREVSLSLLSNKE